jgi:hypothetical protein
MSGLFIGMTSKPEPLVPANGVEDTWATNHDVRVASYRHYVNESMFISEYMNWGDAVDKRTEKIRSLTGAVGNHMTNYPSKGQAERYRSLINSGDIVIAEDGTPVAKTLRAVMASRSTVEKQQIKAMVEVDRLAKQHPDEIQTDEQMTAAITADLAKRREENLSVLARKKGAGGTFAELVGSAGAAIWDPPVLATLPFGVEVGVGRSLLSLAARSAIREAELALASEAVIQAQAIHFKDSIGSPYTFKDAAFGVLAATVGAGTIAGVLSPSISIGRSLAQSYRSKVKAGLIKPNANAEQAAEVLEDLAALEANRPKGSDDAEYSENVNDAVRSLNKSELPEVSDPNVVITPSSIEHVRAVVEELTPPVAKARADVPMTLREFDGEINVMHPAIDAPVVTARIRGGDTLQVINTAVPASMQRQGIASAAFVRLADEAQARGLELVSDIRVSEVAQAVIENLRTKGYKIEKNPNVVQDGNSLETTDFKPLYRIAKEKPAEQAPLKAIAPKKADLKKVDASTDTLTQAIAKLGGLDKDEAIAQGIDPAIFQNISRTKQKKGGGTRKVTVPAPENMPLGIKGGRLFKAGGKTFDEMRELLAERGYVGDDLNELLDKLNSELSGEKQFSKFADLDNIMAEREARMKEASDSMGDDTLGNADVEIQLAMQRLATEDVKIEVETAAGTVSVSARDVLRALSDEQDTLTKVETCIRSGNVT